MTQAAIIRQKLEKAMAEHQLLCEQIEKLEQIRNGLWQEIQDYKYQVKYYEGFSYKKHSAN
jgi:hypothetical protein